VESGRVRLKERLTGTVWAQSKGEALILLLLASLQRSKLPLKFRRNLTLPEGGTEMEKKVNFAPSLNWIITLLVFLSLSYGCAHIPRPITDFYQRPGIDLRQYERIAVLNFGAPLNATSAGIEASDIVGLELMKKGYVVVERSRVGQILREQGLGLTGALDESTTAEIGKILGVQALIVGSVGNYKTDKTTMILPTMYGPMGGTQVSSSASVTMKMIDVKDAVVIWAGHGNCVFRGNNPVVPLRAAIAGMLKSLPPK
jgi:hypothetical protein